jgi:hypothetical protein
VRGLKWEIQIRTPKSFSTVRGTENADAMTDDGERTIYLKTTKLNQVTIRHEIIHAFVASMHLASANLSGEQMEEVFAEFFSTSVDEYLAVCDKLWGKIVVWKKEKNL